MSMKTSAVLDKIKDHLVSVSPEIGRVYSTMRASPRFDKQETDYQFEDSVLGKCLKAFIVRPGNQEIRRATVGNLGFSMRMKNIIIDAFVSIRDDNDGGADRRLEDAVDDVVEKLQSVSRLESESAGDTFLTGAISVDEPGVATVGQTRVVAVRITAAVQDRIRNGG